MRAVVVLDVRDCGQIDWLRKNLSECGHGLRQVVVCACCAPSRMNPTPPPPPASATIQQNADKLLALIESERKNVVVSLTPQLVYIEQRLVQLQGKLDASMPVADVGDMRELASLQLLFTEFRNSSGVLAANAARIQELEAMVNQLTADNHGLHTSVSKAVRDAQIASNKEEQANKALVAFLKQLAPIGIGQRDDGSLGFSADWKTVLEALQTTAPRDPSGRLDMLKSLALLAAKMRGALANKETRQSQNINPNQAEVIDLVNEGPIAGPSRQS
jgi:hypothetical protein